MTEQLEVPAAERPPAGLRTIPHRQLTLQLVRFGLTGALAFAIYTGGTLLLSGPLGLPIVLAIGLAFSASVAFNFTMQRHFVFLDRETFALRARTQLGRYIFAATCNYLLTSLIVTVVPRARGIAAARVRRHRGGDVPGRVHGCPLVDLPRPTVTHF